MDGLLIEVLGLRGCGRRQVPTCACRINLQLHSRPLSFTLTVVVALFLFATFLPSRPFTTSPSFPALLSRVPPLFFFLRNPSLRSLFYLLSLSLSLALPFFLLVTPFFPLFLKTLFTFFSLLLFALSISAFIIEKLSFLLISYCRFSRHVLSLSLQIYIRRDSNYIITAAAHLFQTKKSFDLYSSFMSAPFLIAASRPFFSVPSFLDHCSLFSETSHHHISWFPTCDAALYLFIPSFFYETLIACSIV